MLQHLCLPILSSKSFKKEQWLENEEKFSIQENSMSQNFQINSDTCFSALTYIVPVLGITIVNVNIMYPYYTVL